MHKLSREASDRLYQAGKAFRYGIGLLTTHTADYEWDDATQVYVCLHAGLRIVHRIGAAWDGQRWHPCSCPTCATDTSGQVAQVDIAP